MLLLDKYTPRLLSIFNKTGGEGFAPFWTNIRYAREESELIDKCPLGHVASKHSL